MFPWMVFAVAEAAPQEFEAELRSAAWCFATGLRVLYEHDPARPEVAIHTVIDAGSGAEPADASGVAHLVEHLWFQATPGGGSSVTARTAALGVAANAYTTRDRTVYESRGPRDAADALLGLEAARLLDPLEGVDARSLEVERNIVRNELRQRFTDTGWSALDGLFAAMFPEGHPYHRPVGGTDATVSGLGVPQARAFATAWYRPEHTTIAVAGPIEPAAFADLLVQRFPAKLIEAGGAVEAPCKPRPAPLPLPEASDRAPLRWEAAVTGRSALAAWTLPPGTEMTASFDLFLYEVSMERELARRVDCWAEPLRHAVIGRCGFGLDPEEDAQKLLARGVGAAADVFQPNQRQTLSNTDKRWRDAEQRRLYRSLERAGGERAALYFHETGQQDWAEAIVRAIKVNDFSEAARYGLEHLTLKRAQLVVIEPSVDDPAGLPEQHAFREARSAAAVEPAKVTARFLEQVAGEPDWKAARQFPIRGGITLTVFPAGRLEVARAALVFPGGWRAEPKPLIDWVTWASLPAVDAYGRDTANGLLGTWTERRTSASWEYILSGIDLHRQFSEMLRHLRTQAPTIDVQQSVKKMRVVELTAHGRARVERDERLLPGTPQSPDAIRAAITSFQAKEIKDYARNQLRPDGAHLVVVGRVDPDEVAALARTAFGGLRSTGVARAEPQRVRAEPPAPAVLVFEEDVDRAQAAIALSCRLDDLGMARVVTERAVEQALSGLRERSGVTYGVHASVGYDEGGARLDVYTRVQRDAAPDAVLALRDGVRAVAANGVSATALAAAKVAASVSLADMLQSPDQVLAFAIARARSGTLKSGTLAGDIATVDAAGIRASLAPCVGHEVITVVGSKIRDPLAAKGLLTDPG